MGRNVRIEVQIRSAALVRQGTYQGTHQSSQTQLLVVSDGLQGRLFIGKRVPNVVWYRDYLKSEGYLVGEIVFREVGTSLIVQPRILGNQIEVTLTPEISYETNDGRGSIAVKRLSTTVRLYDGESMEVGGGIRRSQFEDQFYRHETGEAVQIVLTPRIMDL